MGKSVHVIIEISTDPRVDGRYFADLRDTSRPTQDPRGRQMTTRTGDADRIREFIGAVEGHAERNGVTVKITDETGELGL